MAEHASPWVFDVSEQDFMAKVVEPSMNAVVMIDSELVIPSDGDDPFRIPATKLAEELGNRIVTNMVMLGYFTAVTGIVGLDVMKKAIQDSVKPRFVDLNLKAFTTGYEFRQCQEKDLAQEKIPR